MTPDRVPHFRRRLPRRPTVWVAGAVLAAGAWTAMGCGPNDKQPANAGPTPTVSATATRTASVMPTLPPPGTPSATPTLPPPGTPTATPTPTPSETGTPVPSESP